MKMIYVSPRGNWAEVREIYEGDTGLVSESRTLADFSLPDCSAISGGDLINELNV